MATTQSATAQNPTAPRSGFAGAFDALLGAGTNLAIDLLQVKAGEKVAVENAERDVRVQQVYNDLARQSPNLGPNTVAPATQQAVNQTALLTGIDLRDSGTQRLLIFGIFAVVGVFIVVKILRRK